MFENASTYLLGHGDVTLARPEAVVAAVCAPSHQSDLSGADVLDVAELLGIDFAAAPFSVEDLQLAIEVELELENECTPSMVDTLDDDLVEVGKVAVAHLRDRSDYYSQMTQVHAPGDPPLPRFEHADVGAD